MSIENTDFREEALDLDNPYDVKMVKEFLAQREFDYVPSDVDYTMIIYNLNDKIIGTGSFKKQTLKYVVVAEKFKGTTAFAQIVTHLMDIVLREYKHIFVFTRPETSILFESLGFNHIATAEPLFTALEFGYESIKTYCNYLSKLKQNNVNEVASIVVNCNPFTNGHKFLIEKAASENEIVYLFLVEEDKSIFPFHLRWNLVKEGIKHLNNVIMIKGGDYVVSGNIFPSYFLKKESADEILIKQAELDITIFAKYLVPILEIKRRYVGTEVYCKTTAAYNKAMKKILPHAGVEVIEINRKAIGKDEEGSPNFISASKVRKAIQDEKLEYILEFLPEPTKNYLMSDESNPIKEKIKISNSRH
ncbi:MAG: [citrate (pro-3S)-lyase] ligase [Hyphomicrobiales bacterium]